jgi:hypothetical protein
VQSKSEWSRVTWIYIWQQVSAYPDSPSPAERAQMETWIRAIADQLPCKLCQEHFSQHIQSARFLQALESRTKLFQFFFYVHNDINARLGKPALSPLEQVAVVSKLINWPGMWVMPTPTTDGTILSATTTGASPGSVPWWSLIILGVLALTLGTALGVFVPRPRK